MSKLRIGVIGLRFGQWHVRTLAAMPEFELVAIADRHPDVPGGLAAYANQVDATAYDDGVAMMDREALDAVSLCVSPRGRAGLIREAARRGIALFVEKPWATNVAHAHELARLCRDEGARAMLAFSFRYHPAIVRLQGLIGGELGRPWLLNGSYVFAWRPPADSWLWRPDNGNGLFNENSCHLFDAVNSLLGEPVSLTAVGAGYAGNPSEDGAAINATYANGAVAALTCGGIAARAYQDYPRIELIAEYGQAQLHGRGHMWERLTWASREDEPGALHELDRPPEVGMRTRYTDALEHFAACVRDGQPFGVGPKEGIQTVAMAMAVYESMRAGAKPVDLRPMIYGDDGDD